MSPHLLIKFAVVFDLLNKPVFGPFPGLAGFLDHLEIGIITYLQLEVGREYMLHSLSEGITAGALWATV